MELKMLIHREKDNSFVIVKNGYPYHVVSGMEEYVQLCEKYEINKDLFEEEKEVVVSFNDLKQQKLDMLKKDVEDYFYSIYPLYKQNNIAIFGTDDEKLKFKDFHDKIADEYDNMVEKINACVSIDELKDIS
ncbi:MAG: hypothetical protein J6C50_00400 [Rickettsiales bacterium]|nr:hypothetical protein [Rickettsiales bacterium]